MTIKLKAQPRSAGKDLLKLRKDGFVPAVVYGPGRETQAITVSLKELTKVWKEAGESGIISLELPTGMVTVLIQELVNDPVKYIPSHVDFLTIDVSKPIEVTVPLEFVGTSAAVKGGLGTMVKVMHEIEIKGLPTSIPHEIKVDISKLDVLDSNILVSDLNLPSGVTAIAKDSDIVALIAAVKEETDEAPTAIDFTQIEVEKRGKKEEEAVPEE